MQQVKEEQRQFVIIYKGGKKAEEDLFIFNLTMQKKSPDLKKMSVIIRKEWLIKVNRQVLLLLEMLRLALQRQRVHLPLL
jgi:hypothetical protein